MLHHRSSQRPPASTGLSCLWVAISGHGHGHLVQVAPLIRAIQARCPSLRLIVQSSLSPSLLQEMFGTDIRVLSEATDFGMIMDGPMTVLPEQSFQAYRECHAHWQERLSRQMALFDDARPDLVIGDIPYLPLAAAKACGLPAVAVCSLNWADILEHYCAHLPGATEVAAWIRQHYAQADLFLRPTPAMPMSTLGNTRSIGPLIAVGEQRRKALLDRLQVDTSTRVVLVTLGGIAGQVDVSCWPRFDRLVFLVPSAWQTSGDNEAPLPPGFATIESTELSMADLFASCDAMVTKPGYGAFAGAACAGLPVLYAERGDWPEEPWLCDWLHRIGQAARIDRQRLERGDFGSALESLLALPAPPPVAATGAVEGLALIDALLDTCDDTAQGVR